MSEPSLPAGRFAGRTAVVTGGASGIGAGIVRRLAAEGADVVVADLDEAGARSLAAEICDKGDHAEAHRVDQRDEESVTALAAAVASKGGVDVLCANAGTGLPPAPLAETTSEAWQHLIGVNLTGTFYVLRAFVPLLLNRDDPSIVLVASTSSLVGHPQSAAYAASKAGMLSLGRSLALELSGDRVRVNAVCPGGTDTPLVRRILQLPEDADLSLLPAQRENPLGRLASPEDIAGAVAFLASTDAAYITGTTLIVDGGSTAGKALR
jgi:NAD(P)-dependent dehydrogenase (short-subunit alcohol dehydrogenase family)